MAKLQIRMFKEDNLKVMRAMLERLKLHEVKDSEWFKDKMLLAQSQEAGVMLHEEQQDFLADRLEENDDSTYMVTIQDEVDHYVPPPIQNKDMMLSVNDHMKSQVDHCNMSSTQEERDLLGKFDDCIKRRTTLSPRDIDSWEQSDIKGAFTKDVIPFFKNLKETFKLFEKGLNDEVKEMKDIFKQMKDEVDQCSVAKKCFEIKKKQLLINNDQLLEENISCDIMCTYLPSLNKVKNCGKCKSLDIVLLDQQETNKSFNALKTH
ncbi:hypothetical protein Tco_0697205 [Tanacetum coccineum]